jgi:hypothetical protein
LRISSELAFQARAREILFDCFADVPYHVTQASALGDGLIE